MFPCSRIEPDFRLSLDGMETCRAGRFSELASDLKTGHWHWSPGFSRADDEKAFACLRCHGISRVPANQGPSRALALSRKLFQIFSRINRKN